MNQHEPNFELARRYVEGTATADETRALEAALRSDAAFRQQFLRYVNVDAALGRVRAPAKPAESQFTSAPRRRTVMREFAVAACVAALVVVAILVRRELAPAPTVPVQNADVAAAVDSTRNSIVHLSFNLDSSFPTWMSPTDSLLAQPRPH